MIFQDMYKKDDEYYTPRYAVKPILKYLKPQSKIWCPFDKAESEFVKVLTEAGHEVIHTHISENEDFFALAPPAADYIISNPPFSTRQAIFKRLYEIGIPFAMLLNFQGIFDNRARFEMFKTHRVEMLWLSPRVTYIKPDGAKVGSPPFQSGYLMSGISQQQLVFEYINKGE